MHMDECLPSIYACVTCIVWCIRLLCLQAECNCLLMRQLKGTPPKGTTDDDKKEDALQNLVHSTNHNTPAATIVAQGKFQSDEWICIKTLANNRGIEVTLCNHKSLDESCVVKKQTWTPNVQWEIECLRKCVGKPNIVQYFDHNVYNNGQVELAMAHCPGQELFDYIIESSPVDLEVARQIACKLLTAVAYLHDDLGIVHRDIKPENIIYDKGSGSLQLIDFGYARPFTKCRMRSQVGTPYYTPPEIVRGRPYTYTVDEWSTGVTLFIVLYGFPPFPGETDAEIYANIRKGVPYSPGKGRERSSDAYTCIHSLLHIDPNERATAAQVLEAVKDTWNANALQQARPSEARQSEARQSGIMGILVQLAETVWDAHKKEEQGRTRSCNSTRVSHTRTIML